MNNFLLTDSYFSLGHVLLAKKFHLDHPNEFDLAMSRAVTNFNFSKKISPKKYQAEMIEDHELKKTLQSIHERKEAILNEAGEGQSEAELQRADFISFENAGAGAEYVPTEFLEREDENDLMLFEEEDAEMQSFNVLEEEFEMKESEHEHFQESRNSSAQNSSRQEITNENSFRINEQVDSPGEFLPDKSYTFSQWLKFFKMDRVKEQLKEDQSDSVEEESTQAKVAEAPSFRQSMEYELETIDRVVTSMNKSVKPNEVSADELARKSSELNEDIVSETLARVYEEQGIFDKAIRQYVKLSLRFPEKVSFFAARIKELKSRKT